MLAIVLKVLGGWMMFSVGTAFLWQLHFAAAKHMRAKLQEASEPSKPFDFLEYLTENHELGHDSLKAY
jgi:hypothetical protein